MLWLNFASIIIVFPGSNLSIYIQLPHTRFLIYMGKMDLVTIVLRLFTTTLFRPPKNMKSIK